MYSDHKPLESILKKPSACAPRRLQGMMMCFQKYEVTVCYDHGKNMFLAVLLSRAYLPKSPVSEDKEFKFVNIASCVPISDSRLEEFRQKTLTDESL